MQPDRAKREPHSGVPASNCEQSAVFHRNRQPEVAVFAVGVQRQRTHHQQLIQLIQRQQGEPEELAAPVPVSGLVFDRQVPEHPVRRAAHRSNGR